MFGTECHDAAHGPMVAPTDQARLADQAPEAEGANSNTPSKQKKAPKVRRKRNEVFPEAAEVAYGESWME